jgi:hypothetical protein
MWFLFIIIVILRLTNAPLPAGVWIALVASMLLAGLFRHTGSGSSGGSSDASTSGPPARMDPSCDIASPSRIRTDWSNPGFNKR